MTTVIQQYLPQEFWTLAEKFSIPESYLAEDSDLIQLILGSKSLANPDEKQNWFNLLPIMSDEQREKLKDILTREKQKLAEINQKYSQKQAEITHKYQQNFNSEAYYHAQNKIKSEEHKTREKDLIDADNLLTQM